MTFKEARERKGLSQKQLAEKMDLDQSTVSLWETGRTKPRGGILLSLAKILDCTVDELLKPQ